MYPGPNGFDTIAICVPRGDGWTVSEIVADKNSAIAARLGQEFPDAARSESGKPASPGATQRIRSSQHPTDQLVAAISEHLQESLNVILQGPPGTGKTYLAQESISFLAGVPPDSLPEYEFERLLQRSNGDFANLLSADDTASVVWERLQLHPNYSYDDLVRGMAARSVNGHMVFAPEDKLLVHLALLAAKRPKTKVILVLDEVNRSNLSSVLGELIFAIEPGARGVPVRLQYGRPPDAPSSDVLALPRNLLLLGTMNTADRSIGLVDYAIRRRFRFLDIAPNTSVIERHYSGEPQRGQRAVALFNAVNASVRERNLQIGHSYFLVPSASRKWSDLLADRFFFEVVPMLREYAVEGRAVMPTVRVADLSISTGPFNPQDDRLAREKLIRWLKP
jgi:5-methylcytosine-specific restriction endonuclease McrBC GTP-binding regulatory subunit McrB